MPNTIIKIRRGLGNFALYLLTFTSAICASYAQTSATVSTTSGELTAGDPLTLHLTFDQAATCPHDVRVVLRNTNPEPPQNQIFLYGNLDKGKTEIDVKIPVVPMDFEGTFTYVASSLDPCPGYSQTKEFKITPSITVNVKGVPDTNSHPGAAQAALSLTQKQFLDTKIAQLNSLTTRIDTRVDSNALDTQELRRFLADVLDSAEIELTATEKEYQTQVLKPNEPLPVFFADFRKQYNDLRTEVLAPIPRTQANVQVSSAHFVYVQQNLGRRPTPQKRSGNASGTTPSVVNNTKSILADNAAAYKEVKAQGGHPTFHATFESFPSGATLYYRQAILIDFNEWSKPTNIDGADFPLARFIFKFHKDGCDDDPVKEVNPYLDIRPDVSVEFTRCRKR